MIAGIIHPGSGLGNQLARYVMTRIVAMDKDLDFGMINPQAFKGHFLGLDMGKNVPVEFDVIGGGEVVPKNHTFNRYIEKKVIENGIDIRGYDFKGVADIQDNTIIDGEFQGEEYYKHHRNEINDWLKVRHTPIVNRNTCVLCFRGGEYLGTPELFLPQIYWQRAMNYMKQLNPSIDFIVATDDYPTARQFFPDLAIIDDIITRHDMAEDWKATRYAPYLILSNASFYILPAWLNTKATIIAPKHWARHNIAIWALEQNKYKGWYYQDRDGNLEKYEK